MGALAIFPIAAALAVIGRKKFEETVFPAIGLIITTLMLAGMVGILKLGVFIIPVYVVFSFVILYINRSHLMKSVFTPGFVAYVVLFVFFFIFTSGREFIPDAAMSQYGSSVRHLYETGCIRNDTLYYRLYDPFPFATLWAYFCTDTVGKFSESACLFANDIFIISAIMPFFQYIKSLKEDPWRCLVLIVFILLLPVLKIPETYSSFDMAVPQAAALVYTFLMVDPLIPYKAPGRTVLWYEIFAGYGFFASCTLTKYGVFAAVPLILGVCVAAFSGAKKRGDLIFTVMGGCLSTLLWSIYSYAIYEIELDDLLLIPETCLCALLAAVVISLLVHLYRKGYKRIVVVASFVIFAALLWMASFILKNSVNIEYLIAWIREFTDKLFVGRSEEEYYVIGKRVIPIHDAAFLAIMMMVSGMACGRVEKRERRNISDVFAFNAAFIVGSVLYLVILCVLYVNVIRTPHAPVKPVMVAYFAPLLILAFSVVFSQAYKAWKKEWVLIGGVVVLIVCTYSDPIGACINKQAREDEYPVITECSDAGDLEFKGDDKVFYIDKDLIENLPDSFKWAVFPAGADFINGLYFNPEPNKWDSSIKEPLTAEELVKVIEDGEYTYVYLKNVDDFFWETYYPDFANFGGDIRNDAIYRVAYDETGQMQIEFIAGADEEETEDQQAEE